MRVLLTVAYDGTDYCGWQVQPNGITIEEVLNTNLVRLFHEDIKVIGASRTDSGVHALGNVAVFDTNSRMPAEKIAYALNVSLPEDIKIQKSMEVKKDFHPRHGVSRKTYEYRIRNTSFPMPINRFYEHFIYVPLNVEAMNRAASFFIGLHDFKSFCSIHTGALTTVRTIFSCSVQKDEEDGVIRIQICGNGFLYNMVRIIAGTLIEIGKGLYEPERIIEILNGKDREQAGPTAPAKGLTLMKIEYEGIE